MFTKVKMTKINSLIIILVVLAVLIGGIFLFNGSSDSSDVTDNTQGSGAGDAGQISPPFIEDNQESGQGSGQDDTGTSLGSSETKEFTIRESNFKLNPSTITVNEGDRVKITVVNEGGTHNLFIEDYRERTDIISSGSRVLEFVADKTGTFNMWCEVSGHRGLGMEGQLIVQ